MEIFLDWKTAIIDKSPTLTKYLSTSGSKVFKTSFLILTLVNKFSMWKDNISMIEYVSIRIDSSLPKPYNFAK